MRSSHRGDRQPRYLTEDEAIERAADVALAEHFEAHGQRWRLQIVIAESLMMAGLVLLAGLIMKQPWLPTLRICAITGAACLSAGIFLLTLRSAVARMLRRFTSGRPQ